jgi:hypothetical protein
VAVVPSEKKEKEEKGYKSISATLSHQSKWEILKLSFMRSSFSRFLHYDNPSLEEELELELELELEMGNIFVPVWIFPATRSITLPH